jgi:hypothetical protein
MSKPTVVKAISTLALMGFITVYRRIKRIRTALGIRVVQDSNAYSYHPPTGLGALGWAIWRNDQSKVNSLQGSIVDLEPQGSEAHTSHAARRQVRPAA